MLIEIFVVFCISELISLKAYAEIMHFVLVLKRLPFTTPFRGKATQSDLKYILKKYGKTGMIFDFVKGLSNSVNFT